MKFALHPEAQAEHNRQIVHYEDKFLGLGIRYHNSVVQAIKKACLNPTIYKKISAKGVRKTPVLGFPFSVIFYQTEAQLYVLAITHVRRKPDYWLSRF